MIFHTPEEVTMSKKGMAKDQEQAAVAAQGDEQQDQDRDREPQEAVCPMLGEPAPRVCAEQERAGHRCEYWRGVVEGERFFCAWMDPTYREQQRRAAERENAGGPKDMKQWLEKRAELLKENQQAALRKVAGTQGLGLTCSIIPPGFRDPAREKP
jgi:hypothetical protein